MGAVRMCARSLLRRRLWGTVAVVVLVGVAGGAVLAAVAGARRTESAYPRLLASTAASDVLVGTQGFGRVPASEIAKLPQVERVGDTVGFGLAARPKDGSEPEDLSAFAGADPTGVEGATLDRLQVREGRLPHPDRADEMVVNETFAKDTGLRVGDTYQALVFSFQELMAAEQRLQAEGRAPTRAEIDSVYTPVDLKVVGIGNARNELLINENQGQSASYLSPAFARKYADKVSYESVQVRLRHPTRDLAAFEAAARKRFANLNLDFQSTASAASTFAEVVKPYRDSLRFFAIVVALTGLLVVAQALVRLVSTDSSDGPALAALGATRVQRTSAATARAAIVVALGAVLAGAVAVLASPLFPLGTARRAEPAPGFRFDWPVLVLGLIAIIALLLLPAALVAWRTTRQTPERIATRRLSRVAERVARLGAPTSTVTGVRFAVQRDRRRTATPSRRRSSVWLRR